MHEFDSGSVGGVENPKILWTSFKDGPFIRQMSESRWCGVPFANLPKPSDVHRILVRSRDGEKYRTCRRQIADRHDDAKTLPLMHTLSPFLHRPPAHGDTSAYVEQTAAAAADLCKFEGGCVV